MANWCDNRLRITGEPRDLDALMRAVADDHKRLPLSFERIRPMPNAYRDAATYLASPDVQAILARFDDVPDDKRREYILDNPLIHLTCFSISMEDGEWLWRAQNWGTTWDLGSDVDLEETANSLTYYFESPNSEPSALVRYLAQNHPTLGFEHLYAVYYAQIAGRAVYAAGARTSRVEVMNDAVGCAALLHLHDWSDAAEGFEETEDFEESDPQESRQALGGPE
jgi:hypothetical protein